MSNVETSDSQINKCYDVYLALTAAEEAIRQNCPDSDNTAISISHLRSALTYANVAIRETINEVKTIDSFSE